MKTRIFSCTAPLLFLISGLVYSHEEPPKSSADLADQDRIRLRLAAANVKSETWHKTVYGAGGKVAREYVFARNQYDRDGRQVRAVVFDSLGVMAGDLEHVYDLEHQMLDQRDCVSDSSCQRTMFIYRQDQLMALAIDLGDDGTPVAQLEYSYPQGDTLVHLVKRDSSKAVRYMIDYIFHPNRIIGYVVRAVKKGPDGKVMLRTEQSGDARGLLEKRVIGADDKTTVHYKYTRRDDGQLQNMIRYGSDDRIEQETAWQFGPHDLPIRQTTSDAAGHVLYVIEYQYEYW